MFFKAEKNRNDFLLELLTKVPLKAKLGAWVFTVQHVHDLQKNKIITGRH